MAKPRWVVIRWLGAFGGSWRTLDEMLAYEMRTPHLIKCAACQEGGEPILDHVVYGLLVDLPNSADLRRYISDAWSVFTEGVGHVGSEGDAVRLTRRSRWGRIKYGYDEVRGRFAYLGLVVAHNASCEQYREAAKAAAKAGVPFLGRLPKDGRIKIQSGHGPEKKVRRLGGLTR